MNGRQIIIKNVRPLGKQTTDLLIKNGYIEAVGKCSDVGQFDEVIDAKGAILLPGLVEAHTHLDKTLLGMGWRPHQAGSTLRDKIETERRLRREWKIDPYRQSKRQAILSLGNGSTAIRSHVDVDTECGISGFNGVARTRDDLRDMIDIQIVAFPQSGLLTRAGTYDLMDQVLQKGADVVGGLDPCSIDRDPKGHLDVIFGLAEKYGKPIDIHLHELAELGAFSMELIIERTLAHSMQGKVTISHAFCLGMDNRDKAKSLIDALAKARIHIATVATPYRPVPRIDDLKDAGVILCAGSDGIQDCWGPYGNADILERAMHLALRNNHRRDEEIEYALWCCTFGGALALNLSNYGISVGSKADLVLVDAETVAHAVVSHPVRKLVMKSGKVVARDGLYIKEAP